MRRSTAMCAMVVAGLLSWTMLPMDATRLAEARSKTCADKLVDKAFTCEGVGQSQSVQLAWEFESPGVGDFQLVVTGMTPNLSFILGCSCRAAGNFNDPEFDEDEEAFLCVGTVTAGPIAIVGKLRDHQALKGEGVFQSGESFLFKCKEVP
jgi:hypothetical protein